MNDDELPTLGVGSVAFFYGAMALLALGLARWAEVDVWTATPMVTMDRWVEFVMGAGFGMIVVLATAYCTPRVAWMQELSASFRQILGSKSVGEVAIFAISSGVAEEMLFRGFLQNWLSSVGWLGPTPWAGWIVASLAFGALHVGPDRTKFLPWTIMALVLGFAIGGLFMITGSLIAPIVAHFTINFFNLQMICGEDHE